VPETDLAKRLALVAVTPDDGDLRPTLPELAGHLVRCGATAVMFREKALGDEEFADLAARSRAAVEAAGGLFILNERVDLAVRIGCAAVHLSFRSPHESRSRELVGSAVLLGRSVHSPAEARAARDAGADYVVLGPIFDTASKHRLVAPLGLDVLRETVDGLDVPVVAIGGMTLERIPAVLAAGAAGIAAIQAIWSAADPCAAARAFASRSAAG
jgi:thiamine-phosphate pyrophosphorylase